MTIRAGGFAALAFTLALRTAPAHADEARLHGTASIGNFSYQLVDLSPNDGMTPWIELAPDRYSYYTAVTLYGAPGYQNATDYLYDAGGATVKAEGAIGSAEGSIQGGNYSVRIDIDARSADAFAGANQIRFTLSPNTMVVFTADGSAELAFDPSYSGMSATAGLLTTFSADGNNIRSLRSSVFLDQPGQAQAPLWVAVDSGSAGVNGTLYIQARMQASISPVPEPLQPAMLLAGLALCAGLRARGRRRRRESR